MSRVYYQYNSQPLLFPNPLLNKLFFSLRLTTGLLAALPKPKPECAFFMQKRLQGFQYVV